jgi:hypothetical protein
MEWLSRHRRVRAAVLVAGGLMAGLLAFAFILVGVDRAAGPPASTADASSPSRDASPATGILPPPLESQDPATRAAEHGARRQAASPLPPVPDTDDPDVYAAAVAEVLFGMDYTDHTPADYEAFFDAALWDEIAADDRARLLTTIGRRIPTADMWEQMRSVQQRSEFTVELVWEPRLAKIYSEQGDWPDGWAMRTVSGTQTETWKAPGEQAQTSNRPAAVTIAMACPPATSPCRLIGIGPHVES